MMNLLFNVKNIYQKNDNVVKGFQIGGYVVSGGCGEYFVGVIIDQRVEIGIYFSLILYIVFFYQVWLYILFFFVNYLFYICLILKCV